MKTINTPRHELICGKIDECVSAVRVANYVNAMDYLGYIRSDAQRMEQKLITRKEEVAALKAENDRLRVA